MERLNHNLDSIKNSLTGRTVGSDELSCLRDAIPEKLVPKWFLELMVVYPLVGSTFSLTDEEDESEIGVEMKWLSPAQILSESRDVFPGIAAIRLGYLPIGCCLEGSGDPYFLRVGDSSDPAVVRIPHDAVSSEGSLDESRIELVAPSLSDFVKKAHR